MYSEEQIATARSQARNLRDQACKGGLHFEAYLPPELASWVLDMVERGVFISPSEATFTIFGEHKELEPHRDLRKELMHRRLQAALDEPGPTYTWEEVRERIEQSLAKREPTASWSNMFLKGEADHLER